MIPILRVITRLNIGGPARQALLLTKALEPEFTTTLVAGWPGDAEGELAADDAVVERLPLVRRPSPVRDAKSLLSLVSLIRRSAPRIVHTHMAKAGALARAGAGLSPGKVATVHTFHGHVLDGYFPAAVARAMVLAERGLAARTDVLVAVSVEIRDQLLELGIGKPEQWRVIPVGLNLSAHLAVDAPSGELRPELSIPDGSFLVGMVGRLVAIKDVGCALDAVARLEDVHLALVGDGPLRNELEALARNLGIESRVHFVGWRTDVPAVMADLDAVLLTSRNEGTPVALIEAAACAKPAVATDVGGVRSVVSDGSTGLVVPPGDPAAVAEALTRLREPSYGRSLGEAGRASAGRFHADRLVRDIRDLYRTLV